MIGEVSENPLIGILNYSAQFLVGFESLRRKKVIEKMDIVVFPKTLSA